MFNESNTIENAIRDRLTTLSKQPWTFVHGDDLPRLPQEVLIEPWLKEALCRINPDLNAHPDNADEVIYKLRGLLLEAPHSGLVRANELFTEWLRGEKSMPLGKDGEHITIHLIDYDNPANNHWVVSQQVPSAGAKNAFFDLVLYVNGIPIVVGEVKTPVRPAISWEDGAAEFSGTDKHYWHNQSAFFVPNLLCFASEGKTFAYGAINAGFKDWMPWYSTEDGDIIPKDLSTVLSSAERLLAPQTLLEILQSFALYSMSKPTKTSAAKKIKLLPRYPQYEAAKQIVERVKGGLVRKGLIWHFQGSGKSLLMLYAAKMLKSDPELKNPTVVVVVDRVDLDSQINTVFDNADVKNVTPVKSCKQLAKELQYDSRNVLITTVFKFDEITIDEENPNGLNARDNIIVLVDEAHRTQEGKLADKMRWALPHAFFFGLTGTPVSGVERNTFRLFGAEDDTGRYMNRYSYKQSIRDGATLPVKFEPRLAELRVDQEAIDEEFERLSEEYSLSEEEKAELSQRAGKLQYMLLAPARMNAIADDITNHFNTHVASKGLKGMVVVYNREACVVMYDLLTKRLGQGAVDVIMNLSQGSIEDEVDENGQPKKKAADWVKWQNAKPPLPLDKEAFKRWQSIDGSALVQEQTLDRYRDPNDPLQLIIVTAKLLTGFDAPICYCMYLDKPLRDHTLLQAMCRTNRLYGESKGHGLIIDYLGVFENVGRALNYDPKLIEGVIDQLGKYKELIPHEIQKCLVFFEGIDRSIGGYEGLIAAQECLKTNDIRDHFAAQFNVLKKLWEAISPDPFLFPFKGDYRWLAQVYESIKPVGGVGSLIWQSLGPETIKIIHEHTNIEVIRDDLNELIIDAESIFKLTEGDKKRRAQKLEINLMAKIRNKADDPRYVELGKRLEKLRQQYEAGVLNSINWLKQLLEAARQAVNLDNEATSSDEKIVLDNKQALSTLFLEVRNDQTPEIIARIVEDIDNIVKATRFPGWQNTTAGDREMKQVLRKTLFKYQLHKDSDLFEKAYLYIREHY